MKKQEYMKPALQVVKIRHQRHLLSGSGEGKANGVSDDTKRNYGIDWDSDGFDGNASDR